MSNLMDDAKLLAELAADADLFGINVRGAAAINMGNANYTMTDAEAEASLKVIINAGDGTKILTFPTSSDGKCPAQQRIVTFGAGNTFYVRSQSGGGNLNIIAPEIDDIAYVPGNAPASTYNGTVSQAAYNATTWNGSRYAATQDAIRDKFESLQTMRLIGVSQITVGSGDYTPSASTVNYVIMDGQAAGGGGGGSDTGAVSGGAGGGGSAGGRFQLAASVTHGVNYAYTVGAKGTGGVDGADGTDGADTTITIGSAFTAYGGKAGKGSTATTTIKSVEGGASPAIASNGSVRSGGAPGSPGLTLTGLLAVSGNGGSSLFGAGGVGRNTQGNGNVGVGYGAGGAGSVTLNGGAATTGGDGLDGLITVYEYARS